MIKTLKRPIKLAQKMLHKTYDYVLKLSAHEKAMYFLVAVAFIESSFFPIPPYVMVIPMVLAAPNKAYKIALVATVSSVLGGYFGYVIGHYCFEMIAKPLLEFYGYMAQFEKLEARYNEYGAWIVIGSALTPFPYKVITITSGVMHLDIWVFGMASIIARGARFFVIAWLLRKYGEPIKVYIDKHLGMLTILFTALLISGFLMIKLL